MNNFIFIEDAYINVNHIIMIGVYKESDSEQEISEAVIRLTDNRSVVVRNKDEIEKLLKLVNNSHRLLKE